MATIADTNAIPSDAGEAGFEMKDSTRTTINGKRILTEEDFNKLVEMIKSGKYSNATPASGTPATPPTGTGEVFNPCKQAYLEAIRTASPKPSITSGLSGEAVPYSFEIDEFIPVNTTYDDSETLTTNSKLSAAKNKITVNYGYYYTSGILGHAGYTILFADSDGSSLSVPAYATEADINEAAGGYILNLDGTKFEYDSYNFYQTNNNRRDILAVLEAPAGSTIGVTADGYYNKIIETVTQFSGGTSNSISYPDVTIKGYKYRLIKMYNDKLKIDLQNYIDSKMAITKANFMKSNYVTIKNNYQSCYDSMMQTRNTGLYNLGKIGYNSNGSINSDELSTSISNIRTYAVDYHDTINSVLLSTQLTGLTASTSLLSQVSSYSGYIYNHAGVNYYYNQTSPISFVSISARTFKILMNAQANGLTALASVLDTSHANPDGTGYIIFKATFPGPWIKLTVDGGTPAYTIQELNSTAIYIVNLYKEYLKGNAVVSNPVVGRTFRFGYNAFYISSSWKIEDIISDKFETALVSPSFITKPLPESMLYYKNTANFYAIESGNTSVFLKYRDAASITPLLDSDSYTGSIDKNYIFIDRGTSIEKTLHENRTISEMLYSVLDYLSSTKIFTDIDIYGEQYKPTENFEEYLFTDLLRINLQITPALAVEIFNKQNSSYTCELFKTRETLYNIKTRWNSVTTSQTGFKYLKDAAGTYNSATGEYSLLDDSFYEYDGLKSIENVDYKSETLVKITLPNVIDDQHFNQQFKIYLIAYDKTPSTLTYYPELFSTVHGASAPLNSSNLIKMTSFDEFYSMISFYNNYKNEISNQVVSIIPVSTYFNSDGSKKSGSLSTSHLNYIIKNVSVTLDQLRYYISINSFSLGFDSNYLSTISALTNIKLLNPLNLLNIYAIPSSGRTCYKVSITGELGEILPYGTIPGSWVDLFKDETTRINAFNILQLITQLYP